MGAARRGAARPPCPPAHAPEDRERTAAGLLIGSRSAVIARGSAAGAACAVGLAACSQREALTGSAVLLCGFNTRGAARGALLVMRLAVSAALG